MSRIGKKPVVLNPKIQAEFDSETRILKIKGPLGTLEQKIHPDVILELSTEAIQVKIADQSKRKQVALWGTTRAIIQNMVTGVEKGFEKQLELNGVGYRMETAGDTLILYIGFSHPVKMPIPSGIKVTINKNLLTAQGCDKQLLGNFVSSVYQCKPCEPYKHKGFKVPGVFYRKKEVKKGK